ncbi:hypothetical protein [Pseudomonas poae]|uniref:hypothetical protein n=1 Tax=Pseudomonas poae TaxID=200451 RepID=UPI0030CCA558
MISKLERLRATPARDMTTPVPLDLLEELTPAQLAKKYNLNRKLSDFNRAMHRNADALISKQLGKAKPMTTKKAVIRGAGTRGPAALGVANTLFGYIDRHDMGMYWTDDIMCGVAGADNLGSTRPLSITTMFDLLEDLEVFSVQNIMNASGLDVSSAKRYFQALRIALPHLEQSRVLERARAAARCGMSFGEVEQYTSSAADLAQLRADMGDDAFVSVDHLPPAASRLAVAA